MIQDSSIELPVRKRQMYNSLGIVQGGFIKKIIKSKVKSNFCERQNNNGKVVGQKNEFTRLGKDESTEAVKVEVYLKNQM